MSERMTQHMPAREPNPVDLAVAPPSATTDDGRWADRAWRYGWWFALVLVLGISLFLRLQDYSVWQEHRGLYFFEDEPVLVNVDGYYYLRLARDYRDGRYNATDELRTTPEHPPRPMPVPLLSLLTVAVSAVSTMSLDWAAVLLPSFLALTLCIPLLLLCRQLRIPPFAALVAVFCALNTRLFINRTSLGTYDTDCLIVAFSLGAQVAALGFGLQRGRQRSVYLLGAVLNAALFAWWWDQAPEAVILICLVPLLLSAALYYRPARREALAVAAGLAVCLLALLATAGTRLFALWHTIEEVMFSGVKGGGVVGFPNAAKDVAELGTFSWPMLVNDTTGFSLSVVLGGIGLVWLACAQPRMALVAFTVPVVLALSAFFFGQRILIFFGPLIGIGIGFVIARASRRFEPQRRVGFIVAAGTALVIGPVMASELGAMPSSPASSHMMPSIPAIREHTPPDALLWAPWSLGYPLMYYTGRRVIMDGQFMSGERRVYANMPLVSRDPAFARHFIRFYTERGLTGLRRIIQLAGSTNAGLRWIRTWFGQPADAAGRSLLQLAEQHAHGADLRTMEACRAFLFPDNTEPVFLLLYHAILKDRWFWYGTWDAARGEGQMPVYYPVQGVERKGDLVTLDENLSFNVNEGKKIKLTIEGHTIRKPLDAFITYTGHSLQEKRYGHPQGLHFEWIPRVRFGALMTKDVAGSIVNRLFIRHTMNPAYFRHAFAKSPTVSLWEVGVMPRTP